MPRDRLNDFFTSPTCTKRLRRWILAVVTSPAQTSRHLSRSPFHRPTERPVETYELGDRVTHVQHGLGRVVSRDPSAVTVEFGPHRAWIPAPYSGLSKL